MKESFLPARELSIGPSNRYNHLKAQLRILFSETAHRKHSIHFAESGVDPQRLCAGPGQHHMCSNRRGITLGGTFPENPSIRHISGTKEQEIFRTTSSRTRRQSDVPASPTAQTERHSESTPPRPRRKDSPDVNHLLFHPAPHPRQPICQNAPPFTTRPPRARTPPRRTRGRPAVAGPARTEFSKHRQPDTTSDQHTPARIMHLRTNPTSENANGRLDTTTRGPKRNTA